MSVARHSRRDGDHRIYDALAVGWALHALEPDDEATFSRHLSDCARCAATVAETYEVMGTIATEQPEAEPSADLAARLRAAIWETEQVAMPRPADDASRAAARAGPAVPLSHPARHVPERLRRALLVAAVAAAIVGLGAGNVVLGVKLHQAQTAAAHQEGMIEALLDRGPAILAPMAGSGGQQMATVVARDGRMQVVTDGLPVNDQRDSTYVLWGLGRGSPVALGTFDVSGESAELHSMSAATPDDFSAYGISLESGRSAPLTPTTIVATGQQPS